MKEHGWSRVGYDHGLLYWSRVKKIQSLIKTTRFLVKYNLRFQDRSFYVEGITVRSRIIIRSWNTVSKQIIIRSRKSKIFLISNYYKKLNYY